MPHIAIIGSGPTAVYTARYLLASTRDLTITMFESQAEAGKGTPYHQDWNDKQMLSNIASIELPPVVDTLEDWLRAQPDERLASVGVSRADIHDRAFFPRVALGEYLKQQLATLVAHATQSITIKTCHEVLDVEVVRDGIELTVRENGMALSRQVFDYAVMATGHVWPKHTEIRPGYFLSPWPAHALRTIGHVQVGIRGTSLSAIDAAVALAVARGAFIRQENGTLRYLAEPGTEAFGVTLMSRKGLLPEADFYHPIPYEPLRICTAAAVNQRIVDCPRSALLDEVFTLFKMELAACDPAYAERVGLSDLTLEEFSHAYFSDREQCEPFIWARQNLEEAKANEAAQITVPWRYAILRMHEVIARVVPSLEHDDYQRFSRYFKQVFVDDYATVPHESIERLIALNEAGKLSIMRLGDDYALDDAPVGGGAVLTAHGQTIHFPAFIEAMGQRALSVNEFPFPTLWKQGVVQQATAPHLVYNQLGKRVRQQVDVGGIALDAAYHPISDSPFAERLYCLSLPFMLSMFPFSQGITSSHDMGKAVAEDIIQQLTMQDAMPIPLAAKASHSLQGLQ